MWEEGPLFTLLDDFTCSRDLHRSELGSAVV